MGTKQTWFSHVANSQTDILDGIERLTANDEVVTVLGSIPASTDTVESEGR
jgi:hypothetical protein